MTRFFILTVSLTFTISLFGQARPDSSSTRNILCFTPTTLHKVNGLTVGIWNRPEHLKQTFNGFNFELLGSGWLTPFFGLDDGGYIRQTEDNHYINGISIGLTLFNGKVNGLTISPTINTTYYVNGLKVGLINVDLYKTNGFQVGLLNLNDQNNGLTLGIYNSASSVKGLQIGLFNKTESLKGVQIGLININKSRTTILINWRTKKE